MFVIILKYKKALSEVDKYLNEHRAFLKEHYANDTFIASGGQKPRVGGIILCKGHDLQEVNQIIRSDPFYIHQIADYEIIEFEPTMCAESFKHYL